MMTKMAIFVAIYLAIPFVVTIGQTLRLYVHLISRGRTIHQLDRSVEKGTLEESKARAIVEDNRPAITGIAGFLLDRIPTWALVLLWPMFMASWLQFLDVAFGAIDEATRPWDEFDPDA